MQLADSYRLIERGDERDDLRRCRECDNADVGRPLCSMRALSTRNDDREGFRPFDPERDGFVIVKGRGFSFWKNSNCQGSWCPDIRWNRRIWDERRCVHVLMPDETGSGAIRVMERAIKDAGIAPDQIGYINAHGTSTPYNDNFERWRSRKFSGEHATSFGGQFHVNLCGPRPRGGAGGIELFSRSNP